MPTLPTASREGPSATPAPVPARGLDGAQAVADSIARYERLSGMLWIALAVFQILGVVTAIAGAWNLYAATTRFKVARSVEARERWIPAAFEPLGGLITIGLVNLVLGGVVGVVFVGFDLWIRAKVLANAAVFDADYVVGLAEAPSAELPKTYLEQVEGPADQGGPR